MINMKSTLCFNATQHKNFLILPPKVSAQIPSQGKTIIEGTLNYLPFQSLVETDGNGNLGLKVSSTKDPVAVEITKIGEESETRVPKDLCVALQSNPSALTIWNDITPIARRDWIF
jgi:hypothetical protein